MDEMNENGELLAAFCPINNLVIGSMLFSMTDFTNKHRFANGDLENEIEHLSVFRR